MVKMANTKSSLSLTYNIAFIISLSLLLLFISPARYSLVVLWRTSLLRL